MSLVNKIFSDKNKIILIDKRAKRLSNIESYISKLSNKLDKFPKNEKDDYIQFLEQNLEYAVNWKDFQLKHRQLNKQVNEIYRDYIRLAHLKSIQSDIYWLIAVALTTIILITYILSNISRKDIICEFAILVFVLMALLSSTISLIDEIRNTKKQIKCLLGQYNCSSDKINQVITDFMNRNPYILKMKTMMDRKKSH